MDKGKLIPLLLAGLLFLISIVLYVNNQKNNQTYSKLIVSYKTQKTEYDNLNVDDVIVVGNVSFWVVSTSKEFVVLNSSEYLFWEDSETIEFKIEMNQTNKACFNPDNCIYFNLL